MYTMHKQPIEFKSKRNKAAILLTALAALSFLPIEKAYGQAAVTLRNPLVPGASSQMPGVVAPRGFAPPIGHGPTSLPPPVGMVGPPTLPGSILGLPANIIGRGASGIPGIPISPATALPPGVCGPLLTPFIPNVPSVPGAPRTMLQGFGNPAQMSGVLPQGGLPGTGGYYTSINQIRRPGAITSQWSRRGRVSFLGGGGNSMDEITQFGPLAGFGLINGVPTGVGYNKGPAGSNNSNFNKSLDLGGGYRGRFGNTVISTGKTVQDNNGLSVLRNNGTPSLGSHQSTDFAQGAARAFSSSGIVPHRTTDFGFPYRQQTGANSSPQKTGQTLPPKAVITNF